MAKERSILLTVVTNFWNSLKPRRTWGTCVGRDYNGTEYYEIPLTDSSTRKRPSRWFIPKTRHDFQQDIPPEWESWLRYRRNDPPTEEEIESNLAKMMACIEGSKKLEQEFNGPNKTDNITTSKDFPIYQELEGMPGGAIKGTRIKDQ